MLNQRAFGEAAIMVELKGRAQQEHDRLAATGINEPAEKDERKEGKYV